MPALSDDTATIAEAADLARLLLHGVLERDSHGQLTAVAFDLTELLASWHRRVAPRAYGKDAGSRP